MVQTSLGTVHHFHLKYENGESSTFLVDGVDTTTGNLGTGIPWVKAFVCIMIVGVVPNGDFGKQTMSHLMNGYETTFIAEFRYCYNIKSVAVAKPMIYCIGSFRMERETSPSTSKTSRLAVDGKRSSCGWMELR